MNPCKIQRWAQARILLMILILALSACDAPSIATTPDGSGRLRVVATTTIVSDIVHQVGGNKIELTTLLPEGVDPHSYEPIPQDVARISDADIVFAHGAGLEEFLETLLLSAAAKDKIVHISQGINLLGSAESDDHEPEGEANQSGDPHTWTDPNNVKIWVRNIENKLVEIDPQNAAAYRANAGRFLGELDELDVWIKTEIASIPTSERKIVTDHLLFAYFCDHYGFEQVGALIPGYSTIAEPSAKELAQLEDTIRKLQVKAIFVGQTVNPNLAQRVAADTGIRLVPIYTGSLTTSGGDADTYIQYMRYNVNAFVEALK